MTDWKELFVDEDLRDFVADLIGVDALKLDCVQNPFVDLADWTEMLRGQPHKAVFKTDYGKTVNVLFWCKYNMDYGEPNEPPVILDHERIIIVVK